MLFLLYLAGIGYLYWYYQTPLLLTALIIVVNTLVLFFVGNYLLRGILFPYANMFIRRQLDSAINYRFSSEFTRLIALLSHMTKILAEIEPITDFHAIKDELNNS